MPLPRDVSQPVLIALLGLVSSDPRSNDPTDTSPALTISGKAAPTVAPAGFYAFTPTVHPGDDRKLEFTILNKPAWASFGDKRGTLYGKPQASHVGTYSNIIITVSDGETTVQLPPFAIQVRTPTPQLAARVPHAD